MVTGGIQKAVMHGMRVVEKQFLWCRIHEWWPRQASGLYVPVATSPIKSAPQQGKINERPEVEIASHKSPDCSHAAWERFSLKLSAMSTLRGYMGGVRIQGFATWISTGPPSTVEALQIPKDITQSLQKLTFGNFRMGPSGRGPLIKRKQPVNTR